MLAFETGDERARLGVRLRERSSGHPYRNHFTSEAIRAY
jgi:hypothetical protein